MKYYATNKMLKKIDHYLKNKVNSIERINGKKIKKIKKKSSIDGLIQRV
jgi:hypothetical protein